MLYNSESKLKLEIGFEQWLMKLILDDVNASDLQGTSVLELQLWKLWEQNLNIEV